jgi:hypothetical protein
VGFGNGRARRLFHRRRSERFRLSADVCYRGLVAAHRRGNVLRPCRIRAELVAPELAEADELALAVVTGAGCHDSRPPSIRPAPRSD